MISGRGLGHTGGTLDKMDPIPGYVSQPDTALFRKAVLAPAAPSSARPPRSRRPTKRLYAIRDVTATVESGAADHRLDPVEEAGGRAAVAGA